METPSAEDSRTDGSESSGELMTISGGLITAVEPGSLAASLKVLPGDVLLEVNGSKVEDVIDVQYYAAEYDVALRLMRGESDFTARGTRRDGQSLGLSFEHPTFDIDIRRCNNLCEFCFVLQMAPRMRRTLYIKDDDYRYSFLFGHFVTLTNLSEHDEWRIVNQHLSPLYVSVHATEVKVRRECLRNSSAPDVMTQLKWLSENGIEVHTQVVVTPGLNDGDVLAESIQTLAGLYPSVKSVSVVPVGLTKQHKYGKRPLTVEESNSIVDDCHAYQEAFRVRHNVNFVYLTDEWYLVTGRPVPLLDEIDGLDLWANGLGMVRRFIDDWDEVKSEISRGPTIKQLTLGTATLFAPTLRTFAEEFAMVSGVETEVVSLVNSKLGESITVAGLLMGEDVIEQLSGRALGDVVVLPRMMFDHPDGISLDDKSPLDIALSLQRPVALADLMGDIVDIIYGRPALYFDPSNPEQSARDIHKDGGWAVEKYL
jgi:putative radical SAM enzyme (TIGR03279 family)